MNYDAWKLSSPTDYEPDDDEECKDEIAAQVGDLRARELREDLWKSQ